MTLVMVMRDLAEYTRALEEELDGPDSGEGQPLIAANATLADCPDGEPEWGACTENGGKPHRVSLTMCVYCLEFDPE